MYGPKGFGPPSAEGETEGGVVSRSFLRGIGLAKKEALGCSISKDIVNSGALSLVTLVGRGLEVACEVIYDGAKGSKFPYSFYEEIEVSHANPGGGAKGESLPQDVGDECFGILFTFHISIYDVNVEGKGTGLHNHMEPSGSIGGVAVWAQEGRNALPGHKGHPSLGVLFSLLSRVGIEFS